MELKTFLFSLIVIYIGARVMGELATRLGQPSVLGELLAGVLLGGSVLGWVEETETLRLLGEIGVMLLLFEVGLESDLMSFLKVGRAALFVALIGMAVPFILGYSVARLLDLNQLQAIFIGATLTATSVAISARVLSDLGKLKTPEANIILGAAVIDDILGLVILSVVVGLVKSGTLSWLQIGRTTGLAVLFIGGAVLLGIRYGHLFSAMVNRMQTRGRLIIAALIFALVLGYLAELVHVAALVGALAAGLVLARTEHQVHIAERIKPVADVFVPIFFVLIGTAVELRHFDPSNPENWPVLLLAGGLLLAACIGKLTAGLGALGQKANRWAIGVGMVPRGEVGLIFAALGLANHVINPAEYGAILIVVALTTLSVPPLLKILFKNPSNSSQ